MRKLSLITQLEKANPYPTEVFKPMSEKELKQINKLLIKAGYAPDRVYGDWGRKTWNNCIEEVKKIIPGKIEKGERVQIEVAQLEFVVGGNTIWIHNSQGATVLRIKCLGKISTDNNCVNICAHTDLMMSGDIEFCLPSNK